MMLVQSYLPPQSSVLDVGCGAGAYGPGVLTAGHSWLGLEVDNACCEILQRRALPFRKMEKTEGAFPFRAEEFDAAICIEVLEHSAKPEQFLAEIARVIRKRAFFSVPNMEVIPYFHAWQVVPWHLLEADHKNFFTRASLRELLRVHFRKVEVFSAIDHPLRTPEGIALHAHLFAVAEK